MYGPWWKAYRSLNNLWICSADKSLKWIELKPYWKRGIAEASWSFNWWAWRMGNPGFDGLPVEYFWHLLNVISNSLENGVLPLSYRKTVITLLLWPARLSLTYKIFLKALGTRLKDVLEQIIHMNQTNCIPGRFIIDNITLVWDLSEVAKMTDTELGLISVDQEKVFLLFFLFATHSRQIQF